LETEQLLKEKDLQAIVNLNVHPSNNHSVLGLRSLKNTTGSKLVVFFFYIG